MKAKKAKEDIKERCRALMADFQVLPFAFATLAKEICTNFCDCKSEVKFNPLLL